MEVALQGDRAELASAAQISTFALSARLRSRDLVRRRGSLGQLRRLEQDRPARPGSVSWLWAGRGIGSAVGVQGPPPQRTRRGIIRGIIRGAKPRLPVLRGLS